MTLNQQLQVEIIKLYDMYLSETKEERTVMLNEFDKESKDYGKQVPREFKGDLDGFINWMRKKL